MGIQNNPELKRLRRRVITRRQVRRAVLGDENGVVYDPTNTGYVRVRYPSSTDENGNSTLSPYTLVKVGTVNYLDRPGRGVLVGYDYEDELAIVGADTQDYRAAGINPAILNSATAQTQFIDLRDAKRLMSRPVGTAGTPSTRVTVLPSIFDHYHERVVYRGTETQASKPDLSAHIPAIGQERIVIVWVSLLDQTTYTTASNAQTLLTGIDATDFAEAIADKPYEAVPVQAYYLIGGTTSVGAGALYEDMRQWLSVPDRTGFPSRITHREYVRVDYKVTTYGTLTIEKALTIAGGVTTL